MDMARNAKPVGFVRACARDVFVWLRCTPSLTMLPSPHEGAPMNRIYTWGPQVVTIIALLWAFKQGNPYGYFILLRWVCFLAFGFLAFTALAESRKGWCWVLAIAAVVYNPIIPIHLSRGVWLFLNGGTIGVAALSILAFNLASFRESNSTSSESKAVENTPEPPTNMSVNAGDRRADSPPAATKTQSAALAKAASLANGIIDEVKQGRRDRIYLDMATWPETFKPVFVFDLYKADPSLTQAGLVECFKIVQALLTGARTEIKSPPKEMENSPPSVPDPEIEKLLSSAKKMKETLAKMKFLRKLAEQNLERELAKQESEKAKNRSGKGFGDGLK